jgi:hypothetical protein
VTAQGEVLMSAHRPLGRPHRQRSRYLRLLDADAAGIDWRITAQLILPLDPAADLDRAQVVYEGRLAQARRMTRVGYHLLLK